MAVGAALALGCFSRFPWPLRIVFFYLAAVLLVGILYSQSRGRMALPRGRAGRPHLLRPALRRAALVDSGRGADRGDRRPGRDLRRLAGGPGPRRRDSPDDRERYAARLPPRAADPQCAEDCARPSSLRHRPRHLHLRRPRYRATAWPSAPSSPTTITSTAWTTTGLPVCSSPCSSSSPSPSRLGSRIRPETVWPDRVLGAAGLAAWCALLVHSFLDFNLHIPANAMFLFALTGMALRRGPAEDAPHHWSTISLAPFRRPLSWALAILSLLYGAEVVRTALSDIPYESALADAEFQPTSQTIHGVQEALAFDSGNVQALALLGDLRRGPRRAGGGRRRADRGRPGRRSTPTRRRSGATRSTTACARGRGSFTICWAATPRPIFATRRP